MKRKIRKVKNSVNHITYVIDLGIKYSELTGYRVCYDPSYCFDQEVMFAGTFVDLEDKSKSVIVFDDFFLILPEEVRLDVLMHEVGHIETGAHGENISHTDKEIMSDIYAAKRRGIRGYINRRPQLMKIYQMVADIVGTKIDDERFEYEEKLIAILNKLVIEDKNVGINEITIIKDTLRN